MKRIISTLFVTLLLALPLLGDEYTVTLFDKAAADPGVVADIARMYNGQVDPLSPAGGLTFSIHLSAERAKLLAADPRVRTVVDSVSGHSVDTMSQTTTTLGTYLYDGSGNIYAIGNEQYFYDLNSRLTYASTGAGIQDFTYDAFGNRTAAHTASGTCNQGAQCEDVPSISKTTNHITSGSPIYDDAGNLTSYASHSYTYDSLGMMTHQKSGALDRQYFYTADDERIAVYSGGQWEWSIRDPQSHVIRQFTSNDTTSSFASDQWNWVADDIFRGGLLLASDRPNIGRRHFHLDHLGTPRLITDDYGRKVAAYEYYSFGPQPDNGTAEMPEEQLKFTGHQRDLAAGDLHVLDYMHARYYDGAVGRFLSVDPDLPVANLTQPQRWNRYSYVANNPITSIDPDGKELWLIGSSGDQRLIEDLVNAGLNGYKLSIGKNGKAELVETQACGVETKEQAALRSSLQKVIDDPSRVMIPLFSNTDKALGGEFNPAVIDPPEVAAGGPTGPYSAPSIFGHEVMEQYLRQVVKGDFVNYNAAHNVALGFEEQFSGWNRIDDKRYDYGNGMIFHVLRYYRDGKTVDVRFMEGAHRDIVGEVDRKPVEP